MELLLRQPTGYWAVATQACPRRNRVRGGSRDVLQQFYPLCFVLFNVFLMKQPCSTTRHKDFCKSLFTQLSDLLLFFLLQLLWRPGAFRINRCLPAAPALSHDDGKQSHRNPAGAPRRRSHPDGEAIQLPPRVSGKVRDVPWEPRGFHRALGVPVITSPPPPPCVCDM